MFITFRISKYKYKENVCLMMKSVKFVRPIDNNLFYSTFIFLMWDLQSFLENTSLGLAVTQTLGLYLPMYVGDYAQKASGRIQIFELCV